MPNNPRPTLSELQQKSMFDVVRELVRQITSPNTLVREHVSDEFKLDWFDF